MEKNKKWDIFEDMTAKCYKSQDSGNIIKECWYSAYDTLLEIIEEEQKSLLTVLWSWQKLIRRQNINIMYKAG